jgi:hypothetical protein
MNQGATLHYAVVAFTAYVILILCVVTVLFKSLRFSGGYLLFRRLF